jgi:prevent-host-death family protein
MDEHLNIEEARPVLGEIVDRAAYADEHFVITRNGKPRAVIVGVEWFEAAKALIRERSQLQVDNHESGSGQ